MLKIMASTQMTKAKAMARVARETLARVIYDTEERKLTPKVILVVDYTDVIMFLMEELREFDPLEITVGISNIVVNVDKFNESNGNNRLIIVNSFLYNGFSLHDTTGMFPRFMYIMPNHSINGANQAISRVDRSGTIGKVNIRFFMALVKSVKSRF